MHFFDHLNPEPSNSCPTPPPSLNPSPPHSLPRPTGVRSSPTLSAELDGPQNRLCDNRDSGGCAPGGDCRKGDCNKDRGASLSASAPAAAVADGEGDTVCVCGSAFGETVGASLVGLNCTGPGSGGNSSVGGISGGGSGKSAKSRISPVLGLVSTGEAALPQGRQAEKSGLPDDDDDCALERLTLCNDTTPI